MTATRLARCWLGVTQVTIASPAYGRAQRRSSISNRTNLKTESSERIHHAQKVIHRNQDELRVRLIVGVVPLVRCLGELVELKARVLPRPGHVRRNRVGPVKRQRRDAVRGE